MTATRKQLRRDILSDLGDLRVLTATSAGTTDTFIDTVNLPGEVGAYAGREVIFTGGTAANIGEIRYVTGSSATQRAIGFGVSLPAVTAVGDECELINTRGTGYRVQDANDAINRAIRMMRDLSPVMTSHDDSVFAKGEGIPVPANFVTIERVQWNDETDADVWHTIKKARALNQRGWFVDHSTRTIVVGNDLMTNLDGRTFRIWGLAEPSELWDDEDTTEVNEDYIVAMAKAVLTSARYLRMPTPETERSMFMIQQQANALRSRAITRRGPFSVTL